MEGPSQKTTIMGVQWEPFIKSSLVQAWPGANFGRVDCGEKEKATPMLTAPQAPDTASHSQPALRYRNSHRGESRPQHRWDRWNLSIHPVKPRSCPV